MPKIQDLGMTDAEYMHLVEQGFYPVQEQTCAKNLIRAGVPVEEAYQVVPLLKKLERSPNEEALASIARIPAP